MTTSYPSAGDPGAARCSDTATGSIPLAAMRATQPPRTASPGQPAGLQLVSMPRFAGPVSLASALRGLMETARDHLTPAEARYLAELDSHASQMARNLAAVTEGIGNLIADDTESGALQERNGAAALMFTVSAQIETIGALLDLAHLARDTMHAQLTGSEQ